jgi:sulfoxide reductase heme-binding subunit YedZ
MTGPDPLDHGWWLVSRSAGIVAMLAVSVAVLTGLLLANRLAPGNAKKTVIAVHESSALAGLVAIAVHGITLLGDRFLDPSLLQIALPFTLEHERAFTGIGVVAGWLAALMGLSFYARRRIGGRRWRTLHRGSVAVWALGVVHTLGAGTDASQPWMRAILLVTGIPIVFLFFLRILPADAPERIDVSDDRPVEARDIEISGGSQETAALWAHGVSQAQQARGDHGGDDDALPRGARAAGVQDGRRGRPGTAHGLGV